MMGLALSIPSSPDRGSWLPPLSAEKGDTGWRRNTAEIVTLAKAKLPVVPDYARRCAALIRETFPAPSQYQMCLAAARMTGASPDTFDRILSGSTKSPDAKLMLVVMAIRAARDPRPFDLGNGFAVRIVRSAQE